MKQTLNGRPNWKQPKEMVKRPQRMYLSSRLPGDLVKWLDYESGEAGIERTVLVEDVLTAYKDWVESSRRVQVTTK